MSKCTLFLAMLAILYPIEEIINHIQETNNNWLIMWGVFAIIGWMFALGDLIKELFK